MLDAALGKANPNGTFSFKQNTLNLHIGLHIQISPFTHVWMQIGARGAPAFAVVMGDLINAHALLLCAVKIGVDWEASFFGGIQIDLLKWIITLQILDMQRTGIAVVAIFNDRVIFAFNKIRQHVVVRPTDITQLSPVIVINPMTADIHHRVNRGRST